MPTIPFQFTAQTTECPVLCMLLVNQKHPPQLANLQPPLLRVKLNSAFTVCQETSTENVTLRLLCLRPTMRCFCMSLLQFMYVSRGGDMAKLPANSHSDRSIAISHRAASHHSEIFNWVALICLLPICWLLVALILGLLKAIGGCCWKPLANWKYDFMQPHKPYSEASWFRRFIINAIFFVALPAVVLCNCFRPRACEGDDITVWSRRVIQTELNGSDKDSGDTDSMNLLHKTSAGDRMRGAGCNLNFGSLSDSSRLSDHRLFQLYNEDDDEDEERDTNFVLAALSESRLSLKFLEGHCSESPAATTARAGDSARPSSVRQAEAMTLVNRLLSAKLVFRTMCEPVGNIVLDHPQQSYSVRGYFLPALGPGYQFISHAPLRQHWRIDAQHLLDWGFYPLLQSQSNSLLALEPCVLLLPKAFTRNYRDKADVLSAGDLSVTPSVAAPCVTLLAQDVSLYRRPQAEVPAPPSQTAP